jgi:uncharacterized membrane protein
VTGTLIMLLLLVVVARMLRTRRGGGAAHLRDVLAHAEAVGIVTGEQRERILALAPETARGAHLSAAVWLAIFAGLCVVAGVSLLIASNWEDIGPAVRVAAFLAALALVGEAAARHRHRSLAVALPLELLWFFLPLLGLGLYGQTFQLSGDPVRPFLMWLALTAPLAWLSPRPVVASLHALALATVLLIGNFAVAGTLSLLGPGAGPVAWVLSVAILVVLSAESARLLPAGHRAHVLGVLAFWVFGLLALVEPLRLAHPGWLVLAAVALATAWLVAHLAAGSSAAERATSALVWLATLYTATFAWHLRHPLDGATTGAGIAVTVAAVLAAVGGGLALPMARLGVDPRCRATAKALLVAPALVALLFLVDDVTALHVAAIAMNLLLAGIAVVLMWHGSLVHEAAQVNLGIVTLLVVLVTRFLDVFGSFLSGGIGFIVAGALLAALAWTLERARRRLIQLPEGASQ